MLVLAILSVAALIGLYGNWLGLDSPAPIYVGVLHSRTGTMALSEASVIDAALLAIEEINQQPGRLLGRPIVPVIADGQSSGPVFAAEARRLIENEGVAVIFGCWTSASRKAVKSVVEEKNHLLIYPVQYEGLESSPNIIYLGAAPNQQIIPGVVWSYRDMNRNRWYLVGSDYVFPRTANAIIKDYARLLGCQIVGESYLGLGNPNVKAVIDEIAIAKPDLIINTINGDTNLHFFRALRELEKGSQRTPSLSFSLTETELQELGPEAMAGDHAAWNYFQSLPSADNQAFVKAFQNKYGQDRVTSDPMEAAYLGVHLWAQAVRDSGMTDAAVVRTAMLKQSFAGPGGSATIDPTNGHLWKSVRIGRMRSDGQFSIVWNSGFPIRPAPYPFTRTKREWNEFLEKLFHSWDGQWANPRSDSPSNSPSDPSSNPPSDPSSNPPLNPPSDNGG